SQRGAVGTDGQGLYAGSTNLQSVAHASRRKVPNLDGSVIASRGNRSAVRSECQRVRRADVSFKSEARPSGFRLPEPDGQSSGRECLAVGAEAQRFHTHVLTCLERLAKLAGVDVPVFPVAIEPSRGEGLAVGMKGHGLDVIIGRAHV